MAAGAQVFLYGCNIAQGTRGVVFLTTLGQAMVGASGGVVLAVTSVTGSYPVIGQWLPPWGGVVAAKVAPGGGVSISYHYRHHWRTPHLRRPMPLSRLTTA